MDATNSGWQWRVLGGLAGAASGGALGLVSWLALGGAGGVLLLLGGAIVVVLMLYVVARRTATDPKASEFVAGVLLGFNAAANAVLLAWIATPAAAVVTVIVLPAWIPAVARSDIYQAFLRWANFVLPMSWIVTGLGALLTLVSALLYGVTLGRVEFPRIRDMSADWKTGTIFLFGGLAGNANLRRGSDGYNMGNFAFLRGSATAEGTLVNHEAGHGLNLAAFGWVFHFIGAIDENVVGEGAHAYSEQFAESNVPASAHPTLPLWGM
jgi:hypothetical protein